MRKTHPNLVYVPATKDKKGREKPAHWQTEIMVNYKRVRRYAGTTKEEALIYLGELRKAAKGGKLDELIRPEVALLERGREDRNRKSTTAAMIRTARMKIFRSMIVFALQVL